MPALFGEPAQARVWLVHEPACGLRAIVVLDSLVRGPAFGGIRRRGYADEDEALADARRLAAAMTQKCALAGLPAGGGKTVILDHPGFDPVAGYAALGRAIDELGGRYVCGPDIGTGDAELARVRACTRWVNPVGNDAGAATAKGVLAGLRGLSRVVFGDEAIAGRRYVVQGLGAVGSALAEALVRGGGSVAGWDPNPEARARARELGVELLDEARLPSEPCDVFMPCALGGVLTPTLVGVAPWRAVCGSANNQLAAPEVDRILQARGIAWAPDTVVSAGAVIEGVHSVLGAGTSAQQRERIEHDIAAIADTCAQVLERARVHGRPTGEVAEALARERLARAQPGESTKG